MATSGTVAEANTAKLFFLTLVGAIALYIACKNNNIRPFSIGYALNFKVGKNSGPLVVSLDVLVTSFFGAIIAYFATGPQTNIQAITAGLSFTGVVSTYRIKDD